MVADELQGDSPPAGTSRSQEDRVVLLLAAQLPGSQDVPDTLMQVQVLTLVGEEGLLPN